MKDFTPAIRRAEERLLDEIDRRLWAWRRAKTEPPKEEAT